MNDREETNNGTPSRGKENRDAKSNIAAKDKGESDKGESGGHENDPLLKEELARTREHLDTTSQALTIANEELRTSNEELKTSYEELKSSNEELKIANQQLRLSNRELEKLNMDLRRKTQELDVVNSDLHNFYQSTRIAIVSLDNELAIRSFSPAAAKLLELGEGDVGTPASRIGRSLSGADVEQEARRVIDDFESQNIEVVHRPSGRHHVMQMRLYRTLDNVIKGVVVSLIDIDELRKTRMDLRIREKMLGLVTDSVPMLMAYIDSDEIYRFCNAAYLQWFGLEREEVEGKKVVEVVGEAAYRTIKPYLARALAGEHVRYGERLEYSRGGVKWISASYQPHSDEGQQKGVIVCVQDESERVRRQRQLGRLAAIVNSAHEVIIGKDTESIITEWNRGAEELFGYTAEEAVGVHCFLTIPEEEQEKFSALQVRLLRGESVEPIETVRLARDGRRIPMLMSLSAIRSEQGEIIGLSTVGHDISDRLKAEKQLAELNERLEEKVIVRTEQLRNLAARLMSLEQAERRRFSQLLHDEIQQALAAAKMLVERGYELSPAPARPSLSESLRLLGEAMDHARIITTELSPPLFFETGVSVCLQWIMRWAEAKFDFFVNIAVEGKERPIAEETGYFLYRALRELLFNSYRHGGVEEADVTVIFQDDGALEISVEDRGSGFDTQRIDTPANEHFGVLSVVEQVRAMGGRIEIISQPGDGTRTVITLPPSMIEPEAPAESPAEARESLLADNRRQVEEGGAKPVILIVDDQEDLRFTLRLMLEELCDSYIFVEAEGGEQALEMVKEYHPRLVLMDISMPGMSGVEATRRIKELDEAIVVIGLSMHEREDMEAAMRSAGAVRYVTKDSASEVILEVIEDCLRQAR